jgi:hypothetical protein
MQQILKRSQKSLFSRIQSDRVIVEAIIPGEDKVSTAPSQGGESGFRGLIVR